MFCFLLSVLSLVCGILYVAVQYEVAVGWVQIFLGLLCLALVFVWKRAEMKEKKGNKE